MLGNQGVFFTYDAINQLKTESRNSVTITYSYNLGGNITSKTTIGASNSAVNYAYENENWKDILTSYKGDSI